MKLCSLSLLFFCGFSCNILGQSNEFAVAGIPPSLLQHANAVIRNEEIKIEINAVDKMTVYTSRTVTVLNENGNTHSAAGQYYNKSLKIKDQRATVYDAEGKEIKKYKQKDFLDVSAISSNDLYTDTRVEYLNFTPQNYPYTMVYESVIENKSTVFLNPWNPVSGYYLSVERSSFSFLNPQNLPVRIEERNMEGIELEKLTSGAGFVYKTQNISAHKKEPLSPVLEKFTPQLKVALSEFSLVGVKGKATNWQEFGKWQYDNLLTGKGNLPEGTRQKIKDLTANAKNDFEKAELIYQYVQDNTRYISVQLGIGGWEPMPAGDVDRLGYGDCKALTNFTRTLLELEGIPSYYAVVYAGEEGKDIDNGFASMQGNHVILNIPQKDEDIWLECTSQTTPFNYLGDFTDNRNVLLIKPGGGEIVKTKAYSFSENLQETHGIINLDENGGFSAVIKRSSKGVPYGDIYHLMREPRDKQILYYKKSWGHLQKLDIINMDFGNNKKEKKFTEEITFNGQQLTSKAGKRFLLPTSFLLVDTYNLSGSSERKRDFEIRRGYNYKDTFEFYLPEGYELESIPQEEHLENKYGTYRVSFEKKENEGLKLLKVVREYAVFDGSWPAEAYMEFREFMNKVSSLNNSKAVIIANN